MYYFLLQQPEEPEDQIPQVASTRSYSESVGAESALKPQWAQLENLYLSRVSCCPQQWDCFYKRRGFSLHVGNLGCGEGRKEGAGGGDRERRKNHSAPVSDSKITLQLSAEPTIIAEFY